MKRSCFECKFYDGVCCMYDCRIKAILNEDDTGSKCPDFQEGTYDEDALEKSDYR